MIYRGWPVKWEFQSTLPRRKWPWKGCASRRMKYFNPHFREGSDDAAGIETRIVFWFQSTLPRRKWLMPIITGHLHATFQSTLPRRKWHCPVHTFQDFKHISIHTSAKEVTYRVWGHPSQSIISIHTSAKEVTELYNELQGLIKFQSTLPRRKWPKRQKMSLINIRFQSTLPRRKWHAVGAVFKRLGGFQSTLPRRKWHRRTGAGWLYQGFQSTLPRRKWLKEGLTDNVKAYISIHTSAKEVTQFSGYGLTKFRFQSTLPRRKWHIKT